MSQTSISVTRPQSFHCNQCDERISDINHIGTSALQRCNFHRLTASTEQYARVRCPSCRKRLYHCTLCLYNSVKMSNISRHQKQVHHRDPEPSSAPPQLFRNHQNDTPALPAAMDVDFSSIIDDGTSHEPTSNSPNEKDCNDTADDESSPSKDEMLRDEYLTSLVTDAANNDYEHVVGDLEIDARDEVLASASLSVSQFEMMFPGNHSSQVYFWEAYRHSMGGGSLGGMKGLFTRSTRRVFHSTEDTYFDMKLARVCPSLDLSLVTLRKDPNPKLTKSKIE